MVLARLQLGGLEGEKDASYDLAHGLGAGWCKSYAKMNTWRATWVPGRLHMGPGWLWQSPGGKAWKALFLQFYNVFMICVHLALRLMDWGLGGANLWR